MVQNNDRIFYACQGVAIQKHGYAGTDVATSEMIHGLQSVGVTTNFSLEQAFELGQIEIYENIEGTPDVEVTLEKVLDGYPLIYHILQDHLHSLQFLILRSSLQPRMGFSLQ